MAKHIHATHEVRPAYRAAFGRWHAIVTEIDTGCYEEVPDDRYRLWRQRTKRYLAMPVRTVDELRLKAEVLLVERDVELSDEEWALVRDVYHLAGVGTLIPERRRARWPEADCATS